jgi:hypothetical protein
MYLYRVRRADCIESSKELSILLYPQMLIYSFQGICVVEFRNPQFTCFLSRTIGV